MTYIFKNLDSDATFEDFRAKHIEAFGDDYFEFTEEIPAGRISDANDEFITVKGGNVQMWIDDGCETMTEIGYEN